MKKKNNISDSDNKTKCFIFNVCFVGYDDEDI